MTTGTASNQAVGPETARLRAAAVRGAVAGLVGGLIYGVALERSELMPEIGFAAVLVIAVVLGAAFGALMAGRRGEPGELLFWGVAYGMFWWYLGVLTLLPLWSGTSLGWNIAAAQAAFPFLIGNLLYGACLGLILIALRGGEAPIRARPALGGAVAGSIAVWIVAAVSPVPVIVAGHAGSSAIGALAGAGFAVLYPQSASAAGPATARGVGFGFLLWIAIPVTVAPLLRDGRLAWSAEQVRALFPALVVSLLFGATTALLSSLLGGVGRLLFADPAERADEESLGARTLRAVTLGAAGGVAGGLIFTVIMVQIGYLGTVARLVGSASVGVGLVVHLMISVILGSTYGLFFRRQSDDLTSGIGWGVSWGLLWWVLGALTILPDWLGGGPRWTAADAAAAFPSLIGHLGFGAALGATFYALEARHDPWWRRPAMLTSAQDRLLRRRGRVAVTAPAVWALNALIAVTVTVLLGR